MRQMSAHYTLRKLLRLMMLLLAVRSLNNQKYESGREKVQMCNFLKVFKDLRVPFLVAQGAEVHKDH